ncbi:MAG: carbamoyl-phosphate synthase large subunit, partial [Coriobacteriaceae bacterium]|nr:carbamoyl-phosphate synthase large subunit [Coriobacteriaceae bacterium]
AYHYKTYDAAETEVGAHPPVQSASSRPKALILGAGPNRIGQGIEFDYCCVHACYALSEAGYETIMVNCNPETVSTDYDTSDKLYFEPLTFEDVMDIIDAERPEGVVATLGGQTPLKLARALEEAGVPLMGTGADAIDLAEDRDRFAAMLDCLGIAYPPAGDASTLDEAVRVAERIGFPLLVRPSYVLGGRGMAIVYNANQLRRYMGEAAKISPDHPVYLDKFLESAVEVDLDCVCDGDDVFIGGVLEHIEEAGIHSGDSACCIPPFSLSDALVRKLRDIAWRLSLNIGVQGLLNIQFAVKDQSIYVIEANPRASRTVPFVSKATGVPLAKVAARVMAGERLADMGLPADNLDLGYCAVKEAVMPFGRFPGSDVVLGPEMKSTGEVMGIVPTFPAAYAKTQLAISYDLPHAGSVFISVADRDKRAIVSIARDFARLGFDVVSTGGTAKALAASGVPCRNVKKVSEGHPNIADMIADGEVKLMVNTPFGHGSRGDGYKLRLLAVRHGVTYATTIAAAQALAAAMEVARADGLQVVALQDLPNFSSCQ